MSQPDASTHVKNFPRGTIIAEEGSPGAGWYVLLSGKVAVFKHGTWVTEFATKGMVFGEIASILARPRTARLVAVEATSVLHFEADLDELIAKYPAVAKTVMVSLAQRLERTTEALWVAVSDAKGNLVAVSGGALDPAGQKPEDPSPREEAHA